MSTTPDPSPETAAEPAPKSMNTGESLAGLLVELGPAASFMISYNVWQGRDADNAIFVATGVFMVVTALALAYAWIVQKRIPPMLIISSVIVFVFGSLTLILHDRWFAFVKPTIINLLFAAGIFGGLLVGKNVWKMLFGAAFDLPDSVWRILAVRYGLFYIALAGLNEFIWRTQTEAFWANFKLIGVIPITMLFIAAQLPITMKYWGKTEDEARAMLGKG
jgi:intracellular septation protein